MEGVSYCREHWCGPEVFLLLVAWKVFPVVGLAFLVVYFCLCSALWKLIMVCFSFLMPWSLSSRCCVLVIHPVPVLKTFVGFLDPPSVEGCCLH